MAIGSTTTILADIVADSVLTSRGFNVLGEDITI